MKRTDFGYIYLVSNGNGLLKIGKTTRRVARGREYKTENPMNEVLEVFTCYQHSAVEVHLLSQTQNHSYDGRTEWRKDHPNVREAFRAARKLYETARDHEAEERELSAEARENARKQREYDEWKAKKKAERRAKREAKEAEHARIVAEGARQRAEAERMRPMVNAKAVEACKIIIDNNLVSGYHRPETMHFHREVREKFTKYMEKNHGKGSASHYDGCFGIISDLVPRDPGFKKSCENHGNEQLAALGLVAAATAIVGFLASL